MKMVQRFLLHFSPTHLDFREAEWQSICRLYGLNQYTDSIHDCQDPLVLVDFESDEPVRTILRRSVLLKAAYKVIHAADTHREMIDWLKSDPTLIRSIDVPTNKWCARIRSVGKKRHCDYVDNLLKEYVDAMRIDTAIVDLSNPDYEISIVEKSDSSCAQPDRVFLTLFFGNGQRRLKYQYSLKTRRYIGNSTMDPELAFIQSNLTCADIGSLVLDPFCGTGGIMLSAAHFGAFVLGTEINYQVAHAIGISSRHGEGELCVERHSIALNFDQYQLSDHFLGVVLADASQGSLWTGPGTFDLIMTDPPYGLREKGSKVDSRTPRPPPANANVQRLPPKIKYGLSNTYLDLLDFAAEYLRIDGYVSFWYPILRESYSLDVLPEHESMKLLHNCEQILTRKCSRRLLVYQKTKALAPGASAKIKFDCFESKPFRDVFLSAKE